MPRLDRTETLLAFFPELKIHSDPEVTVRLATAACRLILLDLLGGYENARAEKGLGVLVIRMKDDQRDVDYLSEAELGEDLAAARSAGDTEAVSFLSSVVDAIAGLDHTAYALFMMVESQGVSLRPIPFEAPEAGLKEIFAELTGLRT